MPVKELFDAGARKYDAGRRRVIFCFDTFYGTMLELVPFSPTDRFAFLDLGAGTGLVSALMLARFPHARAHLLDISDKMMAQARRRFADQPEVRFYIRDYTREDLPGTYPLIVSALSIHHVEDSDKRELMQKIFSALEPGGAFIHADLALGATPATEQHYQRHWQAHLEASGFTAEELAMIHQRMACDRPAPIEHQLAWMRQAGFANVDCYFKHYNFTVSMGTKPKRP